MDQFQEYLTKELSEAQRKVLEPLFEHILTEFPDLQTRIAWNQPMFTDHGTFILGISSSKKHFSVSPEVKTMALFNTRIEASGYSQTKTFFVFYGISRLTKSSSSTLSVLIWKTKRIVKPFGAR